MKSYKTKSRITTLIVTITITIITYISTMNPDQLANNLGIYGNWAGVIIVICAAIINQISEEKRVNRAEELVLKKQNLADEILTESNENITNMDTAIKEVENETSDDDSIEDVDMQ